MTPNVTAAFSLLKTEGKLTELYQDFTDSVQDRFYLVRNDLDTYLAALQVSSRAEDLD